MSSDELKSRFSADPQTILLLSFTTASFVDTKTILLYLGILLLCDVWLSGMLRPKLINW